METTTMRPAIDPPDPTPEWWPIPGAAVAQHTVGVFDAGPADGWSDYDPRQTYARPIAGSAMDGNADPAPNYWRAAHIVDRIRAHAPNADAVTGLRAARLLVAADRAQAEQDREATEAIRRHADRWEDHPGAAPYIGPNAPDPFEGVRGDIVAKRSNSGRTDRKLVRARPGIVQGRTDMQAIDCHVIRGQWRPMLQHVNRRGAPIRRPDLRPRWVRTYVPCAVLDDRAPIDWNDVRHRGSGRNALDVMHATAHAYGMDAIDDHREYAEITPELPDLDVRGIAVHRADMSGQTGVLALTDRVTVLELKRWPDRFTLPQPRRRDSDPWVTSVAGEHVTTTGKARPIRSHHAPDRPDVLMAPADHAGRARPMSARCAHWRWTLPLSTPGRYDDAVWIGHTLVNRGPLAETNTEATRGNRAKRTIGTLTGPNVPTTEQGWQTLADSLTPGDRITGESAGGSTFTLTRNRSGWRSTVTAPDGSKLRHQAKTDIGIARKLHASVIRQSWD